MIVPCYYIICFGCLMGFNMLFYIIFGTNLLNDGPVPVSVFAYFRVLQKRNTKQSPNGIKPLWWSFLDWKQTRILGDEVGDVTRRPRGRRVRPGGRHTPTLVGSPGLSRSISDTPWASSGPKISSMKFQVNWTLFDFPFLRYSKTRKKNRNWHWTLG